MSTHTRSAVVLTLALLASAPAASAQAPCTPGWLATFTDGNGIPDGFIGDFEIFDDGSGGGPRLHVGGGFPTAGGVTVNGIAKWTGSQWEPLGTGIGFGEVFALEVYDDGNGAALYAAGSFGTAGGLSVNHIAKWDGKTWSNVGFGVNNWVRALTVYDDGSGAGAVLVAAGSFSSAGAVVANNVAKWNGSSWRSLGSGAGNGVNQLVLALAVHDDGLGGGPALYAAGSFSMAGGEPASAIAKWDGAAWSALGSGLVTTIGTPRVEDLAVYDAGLGDGPELYAGGRFQIAGGVPATYVARWDGEAWSDVGGGISNPVDALETSASGDVLYAGGFFPLAGGVQVNNIGQWNGTSWSALDEGVNQAVTTLLATEVGHPGLEEPVLYLGGHFSVVNGISVDGLVAWGCGAPAGTWTDLGFGLAGEDGVPQLAGIGTLQPGSPGSLTLTNGNEHTPAQLFVSLTGTPTPFKGGTLVPVPVLLTLPNFTNFGGDIVLSWPAWPASLPPGSSLYLQFALADDAAPLGVALSNALKATTPGP
jgi:trimeric autotransporter adhesin